jgi:MFS superfamily sulfate permease-like transporter
VTSTPLDFQRENVPNDVGGGLTMAMVAVPDSIASASLAGVNPAFAFNSMMVGMPIAGLFTSSQFMNCALTNAMMLAVGDALVGVTGAEQVPMQVPVFFHHLVHAIRTSQRTGLAPRHWRFLSASTTARRDATLRLTTH